MTDRPQEPTSAEKKEGRSTPVLQAFLQWLAVCVVGLTVMTLAAAHAPARIRLLGLFAIGFGLLAGAGMGWLAAVLQFKPRWRLVAFAAILIAAAEFGIVWETHRVWAEAERQRYSQMPKPEMIILGRKKKSQSQLSAKQLRAELKMKDAAADQIHENRMKDWEEETRFHRFLLRRTSSKDRDAWPTPWPYVLFAGELIGGTLIGTWVFRKRIGANAKFVCGEKEGS